MFARCESTDELTHGELESCRRLFRSQRQDGRPRTCQQFKLRQDLDDHLSVERQGAEDFPAPFVEAVPTFGKQLPDQILECFDERTVGNVAPQLIEFAGGEMTAMCDN